MKTVPKLMVLFAVLAVAGCDTGMGRGHPPMPPPPPPPDTGMGRGGAVMPPPPPPDSAMQPYDSDQHYGNGEPPNPVGDTGMGRGSPPRHRVLRPVRDTGMGRGAPPKHTGPNPVSSAGPQRGHEVSCEVTGVNTGKAKFTCREHHASWTFHVSPRSDTLGELHKGQHVRVLYSKHRSGYDAEDVQPLHDAMRPAKGN